LTQHGRLDIRWSFTGCQHTKASKGVRRLKKSPKRRLDGGR